MPAAFILVVEDNAISRKLLRVALEAEGYTVAEAADAEAAINAVKRNRFDMILQDLVLPDMHGFDLVTVLRALPNGAEVPIIAVSGFLSRLEEALATSSGFTSLLVKPVEPARLIEAVRLYLPKREPEGELAGAGRLVLVANDDPVQLKLARLRLTLMGFRVVTADDGAQALALAHEEIPALILSDVLMPQMDGFELCIAVRSDPLLRKVPLVLVSAHYGSPADQQLAQRIGANALLRGTPEFTEVPPVLARALAQGAPSITVDAAIELKLDHAGALGRQLERQLTTMTGLSQRCALLTAEVSLLGSVADALARHRDPTAALKGVLAATLDAAGISKGALYLRDGEGRLGAHHVIGFQPAEQLRLDDWLIHSATFEQTDDESIQLALADRALDRAARDLLETLGVEVVQIIRLASRRRDLGMLVLGARRADIVSGDAVAFARAFAAQIVQSLELAQAFEQATEADRRFQQIGDSINEMFFLTNPGNTRMFYVSPAYATIWQRSCQSLYDSPRSWLDAVHPEDQAATLGELGRLQREGSFTRTFRIVRPDQSTRWVNVRCSPIRDADGELYRAAGVAEDVTDVELAAQALLQSRQRLAVATRAARIGVWDWDLTTKKLTWDARMYALYGITEHEFGGAYEAWQSGLHPDDRARAEVDIRAALDGVRDFHTEFRIVWPGGEVRDIEAHAVVQRDSEGAATRMVGVNIDITTRKGSERKVARLSRLRGVISGVSSATLRARDRDQLLQEACRVAVTEGVFPLALVVAVDPITQAFEIVASHGGDPGAIDFINAIRPSIRDQRPGARSDARRLVVNDLSAEPALAALHGQFADHGYRSGAAFPLLVEGKVAAVLLLLARELGFFDSDEIELLDWLARDLSYALDAIDTAQRLQQLTLYDAVTGLAKPGLFRDRIARFVEEARQVGGKVCVVVLDLQRFTDINERFGRAAGDRLLREFGERLRQILVEPYALCRIGADTFAAVSPRDGGLIVTKLRDRMFAALAPAFTIGDERIHVTAQAGINVTSCSRHSVRTTPVTSSCSPPRPTLATNKASTICSACSILSSSN